MAMFAAAGILSMEVTIAAAGEGHAAEEAVIRAIRLLPRRPDAVRIVEGSRASGRHPNRRVDAFVLDGDPVIYLPREGSMLKQARAKAGIFDYALAAVIWHEMAHLRGADENEAQEMEEQLWMQFIVQQSVLATPGLSYLRLLRARRLR